MASITAAPGVTKPLDDDPARQNPLVLSIIYLAITAIGAGDEQFHGSDHRGRGISEAVNKGAQLFDDLVSITGMHRGIVVSVYYQGRHDGSRGREIRGSGTSQVCWFGAGAPTHC